MSKIEVILGDITTLRVDAIVNAAGPSLLGGGGVDGAIHAAAGLRLRMACRDLPAQGRVRCPPGEARITPGFDLPAKWVIHTVGPIWAGGDDGEDSQLVACYRNCLELAAKHGVSTLAFPAISTGAYGFPLERAARIALAELQAGLRRHAGFTRLVACCFDEDNAKEYRRALAQSAAPSRD